MPPRLELKNSIAPISMKAADSEGTAWRPTSSRRTILNAARRLLCWQSYSEFVLADVATEAGLSRRTIYNQFANREELYCASRTELFEAVDAAIFKLTFDPKQPVNKVLNHFCRTGITILLSSESLELRASRARDYRAIRWIEEQYLHRIEEPLRLKTEHFLQGLMLKGKMDKADPAPLASSLLSALNACVGDSINATNGKKLRAVFTSKEITSVILQRLSIIP